MIVRNRTAAERGIDGPIPFGWYVVDYADDLAIGEVKPLRYFGRDLVLWRGADGDPRMLDAYCRHLGAHMGYGGKVSGDALECPFHAWRYDGAGAVVEIPYSKSIPPQVRRPCTVAYPMVERNRLVWAWYHPQGVAPTWEVATMAEASDPEWLPFERYEWHVNAHIQDLAENGADTAHFKYTHGTASYPDMKTDYDGVAMSGLITAKMETPRGPVDGSIRNAVLGPGQSLTRFSGICETALVSGVTPVDIDHTHVRFNFTQPRAQAEGPTARVAKAIIQDVVKQLEQDKQIWDHKIFMRNPILCQGDGPIDRWRRWYGQFYATGAAESR